MKKNEIRDALLAALAEMTASGHGVTMRQLALHSQVSVDVTNTYLKNLLRQKEIQVVGSAHCPLIKRNVHLYATLSFASESTQHFNMLSWTVKRWVQQPEPELVA